MLRRIFLVVVVLIAPSCATLEENAMADVQTKGAVDVPGPDVTVAVGFNVAAVKGATGWEPVPMPPGEWMDAAKGNGVVVAVGTNVAAVTVDGRAWELATIPAGRWRGVEYGAGLFVVVGENKAAITRDGRAWELVPIPAGNYRDVAFSGALFVAVADAGKCARSTTGEAWTGGVTVAGYNLNAITWTGARFAAVGSTFAATYTVDGETWTKAEGLPVGIFYDVAAGPSGLVAVGNGVAALATDGGPWASTSIPSGLYLDATALGTGYLAVGNKAAEGDGASWLPVAFLPGTWTAVLP